MENEMCEMLAIASAVPAVTVCRGVPMPYGQ